MKNKIENGYTKRSLLAALRIALTAAMFVAAFLPRVGAATVALSYLPPTDESEWHQVDPAASSWNVKALEDLVSFAKAEKSTGLLIVQDGEIVTERYWPVSSLDAFTRPRFYYFLSHGLTKEGWPIEDVASVQKSLVSILVGMAVGKGLLDIDTPVSRYLGKRWSKAGEAEQTILVRHLLSMTSGLDTRLHYKQSAGTYWHYNTPAYSRLIFVLEAATHQKIGPLAKEWVFDPIGMRDSSWAKRSSFWMGADAEYNPVGFLTTPRDLARLGLLVLMDGKWDRKAVVGNDRWFPLSVSTSQDSNPAYGFLWWLNGKDKHRISIGAEPPLRDGPLVSSAPQDLIVAMGHEKRRLYISPSHKLVIVRFGSDPGPGFDRKFWALASAALPRLAAASRNSRVSDRAPNTRGPDGKPLALH